MKYITNKGLKNIRTTVEIAYTEQCGTVKLPVIPMLALLNDFDELIQRAKAIYFLTAQMVETERDQVICTCGQGDASMPSLHWWGCAINRPGGYSWP